MALSSSSRTLPFQGMSASAILAGATTLNILTQRWLGLLPNLTVTPVGGHIPGLYSRQDSCERSLEVRHHFAKVNQACASHVARTTFLL